MSMGYQLSESSNRTDHHHAGSNKETEAKKSMNLQERIHMNRTESEKKVLIAALEQSLKLL